MVEDASDVIEEDIPASSLIPAELNPLTEEVGVEGVEREDVAWPVLINSTKD